MTFEWIKIADWLKAKPYHVLALAGAAAFVLFGPSKWLAALGVARLATDFRIWVGAVFIVAAALLLALGGTVLVKGIHQKWSTHQSVKTARERIARLDREEAFVLRNYILSGSKSQSLPIGSGAVTSLEAAGMVYRASLAGKRPLDATYNITPWVWNYLHDHPEAIGVKPEYLPDPRDGMVRAHQRN